jgi:hypothetical protein
MPEQIDIDIVPPVIPSLAEALNRKTHFFHGNPLIGIAPADLDPQTVNALATGWDAFANDERPDAPLKLIPAGFRTLIQSAGVSGAKITCARDQQFKLAEELEKAITARAPLPKFRVKLTAPHKDLVIDDIALEAAISIMKKARDLHIARALQLNDQLRRLLPETCCKVRQLLLAAGEPAAQTRYDYPHKNNPIIRAAIQTFEATLVSFITKQHATADRKAAKEEAAKQSKAEKKAASLATGTAVLENLADTAETQLAALAAQVAGMKKELAEAKKKQRGGSQGKGGGQKKGKKGSAKAGAAKKGKPAKN